MEGMLGQPNVMLEEMKKARAYQEAQVPRKFPWGPSPCPHCGFCPACGRPNYPNPSYPLWTITSTLSIRC